MKRYNTRVLFQKRPHDSALHTYATPMNDAHIVDAVTKTFVDVLFDNTRDIFRGERVQVDSVLDGNDDRPVKGGIFRIGHRHHRHSVSDPEIGFSDFRSFNLIRSAGSLHLAFVNNVGVITDTERVIHALFHEDHCKVSFFSHFLNRGENFPYELWRESLTWFIEHHEFGLAH